MTEQATTARYVSKFLELGIVRKASYTKEVDGRVVSYPGEKIRFSEGVFETSDPEVIKFLEERPEFGEVFIRVPDDVASLAHREERFKDLEAREKELAQREKEILEKEAKLNASEEGGKAPSGDGLDELKKDDLLVIAEEEEVELGENPKKADIVLAIRTNRAKGETPAF